MHPDTPEEGLLLEELFGGRDMTAAHEALAARFQDAGLEFGERDRTYNSRLAQELAKWAESQPGGEAIHNALFRAYFVDNRNLAHIDVLADVAGSIGLDPVAARQALEQRRYGDAVDQDWALSRQTGINGVPAFVAGNYVVTGAQPYEVLEDFINHAVKIKMGSEQT